MWRHWYGTSTEDGGWRIGIRSFDKKRYYYYAHLRQGFPCQLELKEGSVVLAGDVIGYMGHTGYSTVEDTNKMYDLITGVGEPIPENPGIVCIECIEHI